MITRRQALKQISVVAAAAAVSRLEGQAPPPASAPPLGPFKLPPLPYATDAFEPFIDARTMELHHDKHHAAYVAGLNKAVAEVPALGSRSVEDLVGALATLPEQVRTAIRNHGGGHANHSFFWLLLKKNEGGKPEGSLAKAIEKKFGGLPGLQEQFNKAATSVFGSGWAWLSVDGDGLRIESTPNQESPLTQGRVPVLGLDVWEHAYYLKYQNRRVEYIAAFWNLINWEFAAAQAAKAGI